jgi:hypothetical protein
MNTTTHHRSTAAPRVARLVETVRDELRERRTQRAAARELARELAAYTTPSDIDDLLATLEVSEDPDVEAMRGVLARNLQSYYQARPLAS